MGDHRCPECGQQTKNQKCECSRMFIACGCHIWCKECEEQYDELDAIESGHFAYDYTQDGNGDGIIPIG